VDTDMCTNACMRPVCGDGIVTSIIGEVCDDGVNDGSYGSCTFDCRALGPFCGDGIVQAQFGEACDDAINDGLYGTCMPDCTLAPRCGDGVVQAQFGELCDDGNTIYGDGCDGMCRPETGYVCIENNEGTSVCMIIN